MEVGVGETRARGHFVTRVLGSSVANEDPHGVETPASLVG